jgi:cytochrome b561
MPTRPVHSYGTTAKSLHWVMFVLIAAAFGVGFWMVDLPLAQRIRTVPLHKSIGVTILAFALLRLAWRLTHAPPPLPGSVPAWERRAAHTAHWLLYALMVAVPVSGWLMSSALGVATVPFGLARLPDLLERDRELGETLKIVHFALNKTLLALVLLHVAAALKHYLVDRDGVLERMLPLPARPR